MKLTVEYQCGHEIQEVRFGGKYSEQLEYAKEHLDCHECYRARMIKERDHESEIRQLGLADLGMVTLKGSEKQIKWAQDIRAVMLTQVRDLLPKAPADQQPVIRLTIDRLAQITEAKWWIDHRDARSALHLAADFAKSEGLI